MKYAWVERNRLLWPVCVQCRVLGVSVSGYRQHRARRKKILTRRHLSQTALALVVEIRAAFKAAGGAYGWPRVWRQLKAQGIGVGKLRVQQAMQQNGCGRVENGDFASSPPTATILCPSRRTCSRATSPSLHRTRSGPAT